MYDASSWYILAWFSVIPKFLSSTCIPLLYIVNAFSNFLIFEYSPESFKASSLLSLIPVMK